MTTYHELITGSVFDEAAGEIVGRVIKGRFFRLDQLRGNPAVSIVPKDGERGIARRQGDAASLAEAVKASGV